MNGARYEGADTVEAKLAAVVMEVFHRFDMRNRHERRSEIVDYADVAAALRPFVNKELVLARVDEVRKLREESRNRLVAREATLMRDLAEIERDIVAFNGEKPQAPGAGT